ncbi:MAG: hypothetical protein AB2699_16225 [Candidatus Thiodiazotropha taylori]
MINLKLAFRQLFTVPLEPHDSRFAYAVIFDSKPPLQLGYSHLNPVASSNHTLIGYYYLQYDYLDD